MNLESLANELLLDMFEHLPAVQLLRAFHGLNTRFDHLIFTHFRTYRLDFRASSKQDFDIVCQLNLPLIADQIISLGVSDDNETPQQIHLFRSYGWNLQRFQSLRSLSLDHIRSGEIISDILLECPALTHLNLTACYFGRKQDDILCLVNSIWALHQLIYCYLDMDLKHGLNIPTPTSFSLSMEHLSIVGVPYRTGQLTQLCKYTPCLRYLALDLQRRGNEEIQIPITSLTILNLVVADSQHDAIENLLQHVPNLSQLKIETCYIQVNGYEWEYLIRNFLPKLEIFQLKMRFAVNNEKHKKELFQSFQTRFWLEEHQWFIRFHYNPDDISKMICLYTLPYSFSYLDILFPVLFKSTCSNNDNYLSYNRVQHLSYRSSLIEEEIPCDLYFPNITHLTIKLPVNKHLLLILGRLDRLNLLEVSRSKDMSNADAQLQLQTLLDHAAHLYSLKFSSWSDTRQLLIGENLTPIVMKTKSIRRLNLLGYDCRFNNEKCAQLSHSLMGILCEVLFIKVKNRTNIPYLINTMHNLRVLIVQSDDDHWTNQTLPIEDQFVQWLDQNLPPTCLIKRDSRFVHHVRIWIR